MSVAKDKALVEALVQDLYEAAMTKLNVAAINEALMPLALIAVAYEASALDEARPEHVASDFDPNNVALLTGRGGRTLLTLADAFKARDALLGRK